MSLVGNMWRWVRRYGQIAVPMSPKVKEVLGRIGGKSRSGEYYIPAWKEQIAGLKDLNTPLVMNMRSLTNDQLLSTLRSFALTEEGSQELYQMTREQVERRYRSLTGEQLAAICYYFARAKMSDEELNQRVEREFLKDMARFSATAIGHMTYAFTHSASDGFFKSALNVFKSNPAAFSAENGLLLFTGIHKKGLIDSSLSSSLSIWLKNIQTSQPILVHLYYLFLQFHVSDSVLQILSSKFRLENMDLRTAEELLGCYVTGNRRKGVMEVAGRVKELLGRSDVDVMTVGRLIYTVKRIPEVRELVEEVHAFLQRNMVLFTPEEISHIGAALLATQDSNESTQRVLTAALASVTLSTTDLLRLLFACNSESRIIPTLLPQIITAVSGHNLQASEFVVLVSCLSRLGVENNELWRVILRESELVELEDAKQYMQLVTSLKMVKGVETTATLSQLAHRYEARDA